MVNKPPVRSASGVKKPAAKVAKKNLSRTAVIGGVKVRLASPVKPPKRAAEIRAAIKAFYATRRG